MGTQGKGKQVRFDLDKTQVIEFKVNKRMTKVNGKNSLYYADMAKINGKNLLSYVDLTEVYSPPRVNVHAAKMGLQPGDSMDLVTGWDFDREDHQKLAQKRIDETKPKLLVGSPECRMFSALQNLSPWTKEKEAKLKAAERHLEFVCKLYEQQVREKRWFLHEHPIGATSWRSTPVRKILKMTGVQCAIADQCRYGLTTEVKKQKRPARKRS